MSQLKLSVTSRSRTYNFVFDNIQLDSVDIKIDLPNDPITPVNTAVPLLSPRRSSSMPSVRGTFQSSMPVNRDDRTASPVVVPSSISIPVNRISFKLPETSSSISRPNTLYYGNEHSITSGYLHNSLTTGTSILTARPDTIYNSRGQAILNISSDRLPNSLTTRTSNLSTGYDHVMGRSILNNYPYRDATMETKSNIPSSQAPVNTRSSISSGPVSIDSCEPSDVKDDGLSYMSRMFNDGDLFIGDYPGYYHSNRSDEKEFTGILGKYAGVVGRAPFKFDIYIQRMDKFKDCSTELYANNKHLKMYKEIFTVLDQYLINRMQKYSRSPRLLRLLKYIDKEFSYNMLGFLYTIPNDAFNDLIRMFDLVDPRDPYDMRKLKKICIGIRERNLHEVIKVLDNSCTCDMCQLHSYIV
jgi:hypothetical protein